MQEQLALAGLVDGLPMDGQAMVYGWAIGGWVAWAIVNGQGIMVNG